MTIHKVMKHQLKFKYYHYRTGQVLKSSHTDQRINFALILLDLLEKKGDDFLHSWIFSDKKHFEFRQNNVSWAAKNPNMIRVTKEQTAEKVLAWTGILDGRPFLPSWWKENKMEKTNSVGQVKAGITGNRLRTDGLHT